MNSIPSFGRLAGLLLAFGAAQFLLGLVVAESLYPHYSVSDNFISDLGVGPVAGIFNGSVFLLGACVLGAAYFLWRESADRLFVASVALSGWGAMGVGIFPEGSPMGLHFIMSAMTFFFGGVAALLAYRLKMGKINSAASALLGIVSLLALALFFDGNYLGLGAGGMERMIAYPVLIWAIGMGGGLLTREKK